MALIFAVYTFTWAPPIIIPTNIILFNKIIFRLHCSCISRWPAGHACWCPFSLHFKRGFQCSVIMLNCSSLFAVGFSLPIFVSNMFVAVILSFLSSMRAGQYFTICSCGSVLFPQIIMFCLCSCCGSFHLRSASLFWHWLIYLSLLVGIWFGCLYIYILHFCFCCFQYFCFEIFLFPFLLNFGFNITYVNILLVYFVDVLPPPCLCYLSIFVQFMYSHKFNCFIFVINVWIYIEDACWGCLRMLLHHLVLTSVLDYLYDIFDDCLYFMAFFLCCYSAFCTISYYWDNACFH